MLWKYWTVKAKTNFCRCFLIFWWNGERKWWTKYIFFKKVFSCIFLRISLGRSIHVVSPNSVEYPLIFWSVLLTVVNLDIKDRENNFLLGIFFNNLFDLKIDICTTGTHSETHTLFITRFTIYLKNCKS